MSRSLIPLSLALFAVALAAVPAAMARGSHDRAVRVQGVCTQQSTSKMKLSREDRGIEVEFQVDQNRNGVPWRVTLRRNGARIRTLTATTHAPSGSFEIRRVFARRLGTNRITAVATRAGETCTAHGAAPRTAAATTTVDDSGHDAFDDHGRDSGGHA
ncbi:MAG TPA: hypothetical protein VFM43_05760 [Gaiellaceae bacterium]|nr:hypothetical protein [Gaiellaceae bacterium]